MAGPVGGRLVREPDRLSLVEAARVLPLTVDLAGTLANGLVLAGVPTGLVLGTRGLRRRARRRGGRCGRCGYTVSGLPICPECGRGATLA